MTALDASPPRSHVDAFAATVLVVLCLSWGLSNVAIKVANSGMQPIFQTGMRSLVGGVLVLGWCAVRRIPLFQRDGTLWPGLLAGFLFGSEFILIYVGFEYTSVARGVLFIYIMPFLVAAGAHVLIPGERLTVLRVLGFCAAFVGMLIAFADKASLPSKDGLVGDLLCLAAAVAWAATTLTIKTTRLRFVSAEKVLMYQLAVSAALALALAPLFGPLIRDFTPLVAIAFAYQAVLVVAASYVAWFWILLRYPASQLAAFIFLTPLFAALFGGVLLHEPISIELGLALGLVALGIYLVNRPRRA